MAFCVTTVNLAGCDQSEAGKPATIRPAGLPDLLGHMYGLLWEVEEGLRSEHLQPTDVRRRVPKKETRIRYVQYCSWGRRGSVREEGQRPPRETRNETERWCGVGTCAADDDENLIPAFIPHRLVVFLFSSCTVVAAAQP